MPDQMEKGHTMTNDENFTRSPEISVNGEITVSMRHPGHGRGPRYTGPGTAISARSGYRFKRVTGKGVPDTILWEVLVGPHTS